MTRMNRLFFARYSLFALFAMAIAGCQSSDKVPAGVDSTGTATAVHSKPESEVKPQPSPGKPSAPINIDYEIMGKPVVGIPLSINVKITSSLNQPIRVNYRINDTTSLAFPDVQAKTVSLIPIGDAAYSTEQVTVIPQREGRLFLNISAEIETEIGSMARVMAIPIQVGAVRSTPRVNGELTTDEDGEALISMPAKEE